MAAREVKFGAQMLVQGRDFVRKRGAVLLVDLNGAMACCACGHRWTLPISDQGFCAAKAAVCPRCNAGTQRALGAEQLAEAARAAPSVGRYLIYGLLDPRDDSLGYIGKTHKRREIRLRDHVENALTGKAGPVFDWIRELAGEGLSPVIFVLERLAPSDDWREAERAAIARWRAWPCSKLPYLHPPQTRKSPPVAIRRVSLLNVAPGG